jgi:2-keto-4-pentenoate hydratase
MAFDARRAADHLAQQHAQRLAYANLPVALAPTTVAEAYAVQEALADLLIATQGRIAGRKIATTTRIMQELMGIDHPCGGLIFERRIHTSPARIAKSRFVNMVVECELAVRLAQDLPAREQSYTRDDVARAIGSIMPAFELIEDRLAIYKETQALSLIADNAWNGGIVIGEERAVPHGFVFDGAEGRLAIAGDEDRVGRTDDPLGALAWVANLAVERGAPMRKGMVVITGSVIPTLPIAVGQTFTFEIRGLGAVSMTAD